MEVPLDEENAEKVFRLIDILEESDDVQNVYANYSVSPTRSWRRLADRVARRA